MSIVKVIEVISEGPSVDEAIKAGLKEAAKTVENILQINVDHIEALVEKNKVTKFRVHSKLSFLVKNQVSKFGPDIDLSMPLQKLEVPRDLNPFQRHRQVDVYESGDKSPHSKFSQ